MGEGGQTIAEQQVQLTEKKKTHKNKTEWVAEQETLRS